MQVGFGVPALVCSRIAIVQTASGWSNGPAGYTYTLPKVPSATLLGFGSNDGSLGVYYWSHTGYLWIPSVCSGPSSNWGASTLMIGKRTSVSPSTSIYFESNAGSGSTYHEGGIAEILGIKGEVVWATSTWAGSASSVAVPAPPVGYPERGLLFVTSGRFRAGGVGGISAALSTGQAAIVALGSGSLGQMNVYPYIPGSKPAATWFFSRTTGCSGWSAIIR